ncbi:MAG: HDOD domain-containing protein [Betaproteobacteria bacterium]|nr:HDOD domain-containing protein [Betaproteobacteria bacterium]
MIEEALPDLDAWVQFYTQAELPVLRHTQNALEELRADAETVNGRVLSSVILQDPLMTLRVLAYLERHRPKKQRTDITTIGRALMMIGINPFFQHFENLPLIEDQLQAHPKARLGLLKAVNRSRRAAHWAHEWAMLRHDLDVDEITIATLLHDIADILMWCFAPSLPLRVNQLQAHDRTLRSVTAQQEVYGIRLHDLQLRLVHAWGLPKLLTMLMDDSTSSQENQAPAKESTIKNSIRIKNVSLAVDLARHSAHGWDDPALPDDFKAIEEFLHISHLSLMNKLGLDLDGKPSSTATADQAQ